MALDKSLNKATILGTVGKDPEVKELANGTVGNVSIATDEGYFDKQKVWVDATEWHRVTCWGRLAEKLKKVKKGDVILVDGKIKTDSWEDPNGGGKRYSTCIVAQVLRHVDDRGRGKAARDAKKYGGTPENSQSQQGGFDNSMPPAAEDDLPF